MADDQIIDEIKELIEQIDYAGTQLDQRLHWLEKQIRLCLLSLGSSKSLAEAEDIFRSLSGYHAILSTIAFKHNYPISDELRRFVKRFERLDDDALRGEILNSARAGDLRI